MCYCFVNLINSFDKSHLEFFIWIHEIQVSLVTLILNLRLFAGYHIGVLAPSL
jgi:hypothetical protein